MLKMHQELNFVKISCHLDILCQPTNFCGLAKLLLADRACKQLPLMRDMRRTCIARSLEQLKA